MSDDNNSPPPIKLTINQKDAAKRMGFSEKDYAQSAAELIKRGRLKKEHIT